MEKGSLAFYGSVCLLTATLGTAFDFARDAYSTKHLEDDAKQLSVAFNSTHHLEVVPDVLFTNEVTLDFSRLRIIANDPTQQTYSYNIKRQQIEYSVAAEKVPDFLKNKAALSSTLHAKTCEVLANYKPTHSYFINSAADRSMDRRTRSINHLNLNLCA